MVEILVGLVIVVGIVGAVIQVIPSALVIGGAVLVWALWAGQSGPWMIFGIVVVILLAATALKYLIPGKRMVASGTPNSTLIVVGLVAIISWFALPFIGFVVVPPVVLYLMERHRVGSHDRALSATVEVLKSVGLTIAIELLGALAAATAWLIGAIVY